MPSGSDAEYIPLLIAQILNKEKSICNIVTCNEEIGAGTLGAAGGKFFSPIEPIPGYAMQGTQIGDGLEGLGDGVKTIAINARQESGEVISPSQQVDTILRECIKSGEVPVVHTVYGSKTGITHELDEETQKIVQKMNGVQVVDACQGRFRDSFVNEVLETKSIVLITGSKFYRGPPFSGGVIVPAEIMAQLQGIDATMPYGLNTFIGQAEIPRELPLWRKQMRENLNPGLALRWEAALAEMIPTLSIPEQERV